MPDRRILTTAMMWSMMVGDLKMDKFVRTVTIFFFGVIAGCNPMSEPTPDALCTGVHDRNVSDICHGSHYLDPSGYCSEPNCHGSDIRGGNTGGPSCYSCHGDYWNVRTLHSKKIFGVKHWRDLCTSTDFVVMCGSDYCHTAALTGSNGYMKSPGCNSCHGIPTADGGNCEISGAHTRSMDGARHHSDVCTTIETCKTTDCHGVNLEGGTTGAFPARRCTVCHEHTPTHAGCDD